jgi:cytochrome c oxidase subunit 2
MVDSSLVLYGQTIAYTSYAIVVILLIGWFGLAIKRKSTGNKISKVLFYSFVAMLVVIGVSLHIVTYNTIPWVSMDLDRANIEADQVFDIVVENHTFILPAEEMNIQCGQKVLFNVTSNDLTYGFGLFRQDHSMLFQMQVVPGHLNDILWEFTSNGIYTIRSTEYSGPKGAQMIVKDVVKVTGCE